MPAASTNLQPAILVRVEHNTGMWNEGFERAGVWAELYVPNALGLQYVQKIVDAWNDKADWGHQFTLDTIPNVLVEPHKIVTTSKQLQTTLIPRLQEWDGI